MHSRTTYLILLAERRQVQYTALRPYESSIAQRLQSEGSFESSARMRTRYHCPLTYCLWMTAISTVMLAGCAGYQVGTASLFNPNIRTIYVPIVRNDSWRHELGVQLTEAIQKTIELRTPYKVVASPAADSTLNCRVNSQMKRVITETRTDEPRALHNMIAIELTWTDRQGNLLMENRPVPIGELAYFFGQNTTFVPESGQSYATSQQRAVERLANQIVDQMESRW
ncbi:MAG: hypothetical protein KDB03_01310 [Planctomycetales bacterium]|nr:hypothetical protein [Planctomycetales bacterium]